MNDIEAQLRATLTEQAARGPGGGALAERILAAVEAPAIAPVLRPRYGWRTWTMPLLAAGAVATVVAAIVGVDHVRDSAAPPGVSQVVVPPTASTSTSTSTAPAPTPSPTTASTRSAAPAPVTAGPGASATNPTGPNLSDVKNFSAQDVTFASADHGWAIGSADCVQGAGRCSALFRTTDGSHWTSTPGTQFNVPGVKDCADPCVEHIRFATDLIGYAYGPAALFMTHDGGLQWTRQPGRGADVLETLDGNVIRLVSTSTGCPGPCNVRVERSSVGSRSWQTVPLAARSVSANAVQLSRSGGNAYVLATKNPASGAGVQTSILFTSTDDGESWRQRSEPCPQAAGDAVTDEVDATSVAAAPGSILSVLCVPRDDTSSPFVVVSHDGGADFAGLAGDIPNSSGADVLVGAPDTALVAAGSSGSQYRRTTSSGRWQRIRDLTGTVTFLGFESPTVGRAVTDNGHRIWTTRDAGENWTETDFP